MINSFKYRFILSFVTVEIFFILCIVSINFITINKSTSQLIKSRIESTSQLMSELVKSPISVYDLATLDNVTKNSNLKNVNSIIVLDPQKRVLSQDYNLSKPIDEILSINTDKTIVLKDKKYDLKYIEIKNDDIILGYIYLFFDMGEFIKLVDDNKNTTFFVILVEILISTIIAFLIGSKLTSRLTRLSTSAQEIGRSKNFDVDIPYKEEKTEIGVLASSLEQMKKNIQSRNKKLKSAKDVFDNVKEAIIVFNENGDITLVNDAFFDITKLNKEESLEKNIFSLEFGLKKMELISILEYLKTKDEWQEEYKLSNKYLKEPKIILINFSKIENTDHLSFILIFSDITEEKEKENLLQMQSKMATMGEMIGNIAHQWRQPLSAISSVSSGLKLQKELDVLDDEYLMKSLDDIVTTTHFLSDTIEDFRDFFKTEKDKVEFKVSDIVFKISNILNTLFVNNGISLQENIKVNPTLIGYQNELTQALINIINNAKDVLISNNDIEDKAIFFETALSEDRNYLEIMIADNGGGIKEDIIDKVFEPYFTTKHQSQGTGIGLYMTHTIITKHFGGKIEIKNKTVMLNNTEYKGACFKVIIPL